MCSILQTHSKISTLKKKCFSPLTITGLACLILALIAAAPSHAQGFGILKMRGTLSHRPPPKVYLAGATVSVQVTSDMALSAELLDRIKVELENSLQMSDPRRKPDAVEPDAIITGIITGIDSSSRWEDRTRSEYQVTGSHTVHDDKTNTDETVTDYGYVEVPYRALVITGRICEARPI